MEDSVKKRTGLVFDRAMLDHKCEWDPDHIERPERLGRIIARLETTKLVDECIMLPRRRADPNIDIRSVHSPEYIAIIEQSEQMDMDERETLCASYEDIYMGEKSYDLALLSAGSAMEAMDAVLDGRCCNTFAAIRPPGHHAFDDQACGFCLFNNVAICAKRAVTKWELERVLIVDWDVHAGQGTQYCIADDDRIKLLSIHRYEHGHFWPNLPESGVHHEYQNTINIPLHELGMGDSEYLTIMHHVILPLIAEWKPQLILVSCGYDAAFGDPEGHMCITPGGYAHMTAALKATDIPLCVVLEGGYFLESVEADAEWTVRALLGHSLPRMQLQPCRPSLVNTLFALIERLSKEFDTFKQFLAVDSAFRTEKGLAPRMLDSEDYTGKRVLTLPYQTRGNYPPRPHELVADLRQQLSSIIANQTTVPQGVPKPKAHIDNSTSIDAMKGLLNDLLKNNISILTVDHLAKNALKEILAMKCGERLEIDIMPSGDLFRIDPSFHSGVLKVVMSTGGHFHFALHNILLPIVYRNTSSLVVLNYDQADTATIQFSELIRTFTAASIPVIVQFSAAKYDEIDDQEAKIDFVAVLSTLADLDTRQNTLFMQ